MTGPQSRVDTDMAGELAECLDMVADWLLSAPRMVRVDLERFIGWPEFDTAELARRLNGFAAVLHEAEPVEQAPR